MPQALCRFGFYRKIREKKIPLPPHNLEFFLGSPDFFRRSHHRRLMKLGIRIPYAPSIVTFWFLPKNSRKKFPLPPPQLRIFFGFPRFFRRSHHRRLMKLGIRIPYASSIVTF